jgi:ABC-type amino acid transport substrate-binding protein
MITTRLAKNVFLAALLAASPALGQELDGTLKKIRSSGVFTLGYLESAPPFSFPGPDKRPVGFSIDLCTQVASAIQKQLGINLKLNWVPLTVDNRIDMVAQGKVDIECSTTTATLSRRERVDFSLTTFVDGGSFLTLANSGLKAVSDLADKKVAVIGGTTTEKSLNNFLKEQFINLELVQVKNHTEGRAALEKGAVAAFASDRGILIGLVVTAKDPRQYGLADFSFSYEPYGFMLRRNDGSFRLAVDRALARLYRSGEIAAIYERWFGALGKPSLALQFMYLLNALPE